MKKIVFIALSSILIIFMVGHFFIFKLSLKKHKKEFKTYMKQHYKLLQKIEIAPCQLYTNSANIKWLDNNHEIEINGTLYDIASIKDNGKTVSLYVLNDSLEKSLFNKYAQIAGSLDNTNSSSGKSNSLKIFLSLKYIPSSLFMKEIPVTESSISFLNYTPSVTFGHRNTIIKPPIS